MKNQKSDDKIEKAILEQPRILRSLNDDKKSLELCLHAIKSYKADKKEIICFIPQRHRQAVYNDFTMNFMFLSNT